MAQQSPYLPEMSTAREGNKLFSWNYALRHFDDLGAVRVSLYIFLRDLIPGTLLAICWLAKHPAALSGSPYQWRLPQLSLIDMAMLACTTFCWQLIAGGRLATGRNLLRKQFFANLAGALCCSAMVYGVVSTNGAHARPLLLSAAFFAAASVMSTMLLAAACVVRWAVVTYVVNKRDVVLVGSGPKAQILFAELMDSTSHRVVGIVDDEFVGTPQMQKLYMGGIDRLREILKVFPVQLAYSALPMKSMYNEGQRAITICEQIGVEVRHSAHMFDTRIAEVDAYASAHGMVTILRMVHQDSTRIFKRALDILFASALIIMSSPLLAAAAIAIRLTSKGPIFFAQERYGLNRKRFRIFKLRTMVVDAEAQMANLEAKNEVDGPVFKIRRDPRITPVGHFLRKSSIDELPQLWNVIKGDMSLVGPRPLAVRDVMRFEHSSHLRRFSVMPGLTCLWQISGRNNTDFETWVRQDLDYIDRWSLMLDMRILLGTVPAVLWGRGAM